MNDYSANSTLIKILYVMISGMVSRTETADTKHESQQYLSNDISEETVSYSWNEFILMPPKKFSVSVTQGKRPFETISRKGENATNPFPVDNS